MPRRLPIIRRVGTGCSALKCNGGPILFQRHDVYVWPKEWLLSPLPSRRHRRADALELAAGGPYRVAGPHGRVSVAVMERGGIPVTFRDRAAARIRPRPGVS